MSFNRKKLIICLAILSTVSNTAQAADLYYPPPSSQSAEKQVFTNQLVEDQNFSWAGLYTGVTIGYAQATTKIKSEDEGVEEISLTSGSVTYGGLIGYNLETDLENGTFLVYGAELGISFADFAGDEELTSDNSVNQISDYISSLRGRLGVAWDDLHLYGAAGVGFNNLGYEYTDGTKEEEIHYLVSAGLGAELVFDEDLIGRIEVNYEGFLPYDSETEMEIDNTILSGQIGLVYKF